MSEAEIYLAVKPKVEAALAEKRKQFEQEFNPSNWIDTLVEGKTKEEIIQWQLDLALEEITDEYLAPLMTAEQHKNRHVSDVYYRTLKQKFERDDA